jgi:D-3-phosphoglycerate dehydrogenase
MKIVIPDDYQNIIRKLDCFRLLDGHEVTIYHDEAKDRETLVRRFKDAEAIVLTRERTAIDADLLAHLPNLKVISQTGKVAEHIDVAACTERGVAVVEGRGSPIAPAELAWALIMNSRRRLVPAINALYNGQWQTNIGERLAGKTLGIWGYGKIGGRLAKYGKAFDMEVVVWGSERSRANAVADGYSAADSKAAFFRRCDVISLNLRLVDATRGIVTLDDLLLMKTDALLVNISRAGLIAPGALLAAIEAGRPGFAALDVFEKEPLYDKNSPYLAHPNILCTPHLGYVEKDSYELYFNIAFENVLSFFSGGQNGLVNAEYRR